MFHKKIVTIIFSFKKKLIIITYNIQIFASTSDSIFYKNELQFTIQTIFAQDRLKNLTIIL